MSEEKAAPKVYKRSLKTLPIQIEAPDGRIENWTMRELSGSLRNQYLNKNTKKTTVKNGVEVRDFTGSCSDLLVLCMFNPGDTTVPQAEIDEWPSDMQLDLFQLAMTLSGLDKKSKEQVEGN